MLLPKREFSSNSLANKVEQHAKLLTFGLILLAIFLSLTSVNRGLQSDDFIHQYMLTQQDKELSSSLNQFYEFLNPYDNIPWWTQEHLKIKFWRPFSAFTHWIDYQLWPDSPIVMHLHSGLWYVSLCLLTLVFFKKILPLPAALFAAYVFTLDFNHFANLSWIANRNSLIAACFCLLTLIFYIEWRTLQKFYLIIASIISYALALMSSEISIVTVALIFMIEICYKTILTHTYEIQNNPNKNSIYSFLFVFLIITVLWQFYYQFSGYGVSNNSLYFSPNENLQQSLFLIVQKIPVFLFSALFSLEGFYNVLAHEIKYIISCLCFFSILLLISANKNLLKNNRFLFSLLGTIISLLPVCFVAVLDMRLTLLSSIFSAALIAMLIFNPVQSSQSKYPKVLLGFLLFTHIFVAGAQWIITGAKDLISPPQPFQKLIELHQQHPQKNIYLINYPSPIDAFYFPFKSRQSMFSIFVLNPNFSNYSLSAKNKQQISIISEQGLVFKNRDFRFYESAKKPLVHGVYARSAFNGMTSNDFNFTEHQTFEKNKLKIEIDQVTSRGLASRINFEILNEEKDFVLVLWDTTNKQFQLLNEFPLDIQINNL